MKATKNKPKKQKPRQRAANFKLFVLLSVPTILVMGVLQFINYDGLGWIKRVYYGHVVRQAYHKEYASLGSALEALGLNENENIKSTCKIEPIATDGLNVSDVLFCGLQSDNYIEVNSSNKSNIVDAAKQLDELVKKSGGIMSTNATPTFGKYFSDITNDVDYHPGIGATFVRDNFLCEVSVNVAYANPKPPAYSIQFGCNSPRVTQDDIYLFPYES